MCLINQYYDDIATFYAAMDMLSGRLSSNAKRRLTFRFGEEIRKAVDADCIETQLRNRVLKGIRTLGADEGLTNEDAELIKGWLR